MTGREQFIGFVMLCVGALGMVGVTTALAAGSRRAKTPQAVECEASQSGGESRNAQKPSASIGQGKG